jgi:hypothetical protein
MKQIHLLVLGLMFLCGLTVQAAIQMDRLGYNENGKPIFTITGAGYYHLYLQCPWPDATITDGGDGHVWVTDLGVTPQQNHLFMVEGVSSAPFLVNSEMVWWPVSVEVFDWSMSKIGVYTNGLDGSFRVDAGGPYTIAPGQSVRWDTSQSYFVQYGWNPADSLQPIYSEIIECKIDGQTVGSAVTFDELVGTLGLSYGVHTLQVDVLAHKDPYISWETAFSTIEIIPEPLTIWTFSAGFVLLAQQRKLFSSRKVSK